MITETLEYLGIAFISSAALIVMSKIILQHLIRRPADYYSAEEVYQEELMLNSAGFSILDEIETNPEGELTDEHIEAEPQISIAQAIEMHITDEETIERHRAYEESIEEEPGEDRLIEEGHASSVIADEATAMDIRRSLEEAYRAGQQDTGESGSDETDDLVPDDPEDTDIKDAEEATTAEEE